MSNITYEQPLNERVRTLMRLEHLFQLIDDNLQCGHSRDNRGALTALIEILSASARADLKTDIIKELERLLSKLSPLLNNAEVDQDKLHAVLGDVQSTEQQLHALQGLFASQLRENEFINSLKQRSSVPGGSSSFDLPVLHCWLQQSDEQRQTELRNWLSQLHLLDKAVHLIMSLIRQSGHSSQITAMAGIFQLNLDSQAPIQLVQVSMPANTDYFPEISGGKHRITIRFMKMSSTIRPSQTDQDIHFTLTHCVL